MKLTDHSCPPRADFKNCEAMLLDVSPRQQCYLSTVSVTSTACDEATLVLVAVRAEWDLLSFWSCTPTPQSYIYYAQSITPALTSDFMHWIQALQNRNSLSYWSREKYLLWQWDMLLLPAGLNCYTELACTEVRWQYLLVSWHLPPLVGHPWCCVCCGYGAGTAASCSDDEDGCCLRQESSSINNKTRLTPAEMQTSLVSQVLFSRELQSTSCTVYLPVICNLCI